MARRKKQSKKPRRQATSPLKTHQLKLPLSILLCVIVVIGIYWLFLSGSGEVDVAEQDRSRVSQEEPQGQASEAAQERDAKPVSDPTESAETDAKPTPMSASSVTVGTLAKVAGVDPLADGWASESLHNQIHQQLDLLKQWMHSDQPRLEDLTGIIASDFRCQALRPSAVEPIYETEAMSVRRGAATAPGTDSTYEGEAGFSEAFQSLLEPLRLNPDLHAEFKAVSNELQDGTVKTKILLHFSGDGTEQSSFQINDEWNATWNIAKGKLPQLASIESDAGNFELVENRLPEGALLSDCTLSVVGDTAAFQKQLSHGVNHWVAEFDAAVGVTLHDSLGMAIGDVNGDDLPDLYVCQSAGLANRLFLHQPDGTVVDASADSGADFCDHTGQPLLIDLNNDGHQDLALIVLPEVIVLEGDGAGHFTIRTRQKIAGNGIALSAVDYDADGFLDLYVCVRDDDPSTKLAQGLLGSPVPYHDAKNGGANVMLRNEGEFQLTDVTAEIGLDQNNNRFSQAVCWEDYDNDGDLDAYVANDFGRNNLYRNDIATSGKFVDVAAEAGVEDMSAGMSVSWGDYDNDGWSDLYVSNMFSSAGNRVTFQRKFKPNSQQSTIEAFQRHARGNSLFRNRGDGTFDDVSESAGVTMGRWAWASSFADLNNDAWQDILVANGFITGYQTDDL